jgi:DNA-directed RNA polymerase subunit RPC12/RpoP
MDFNLNPKLLVLIHIIGEAIALGVILLLLQLDTIINVSFYHYGLQFNYEWAAPYWTFLRLALGLLASIIGLHLVTAIYIILSDRTPPAQSAQPHLRSPTKARPQKKANNRANGVTITAMPTVCSACGKTITQPLRMFDSSAGKRRLVNVCPYCNAVLSVSSK